MKEIDNDLASCKKCGPSIAVRLTWVCDALGMIQHYGYCWMCGAEGPRHTDEIMAVTEWNRHQEQGGGPMTNAELRQFLTARSACRDAMDWLGGRDSAQMWAECQRPDWLLWWAGQIVPRRDLVLAACDCVETALQFVPADEHRPRLAIETARRWAHGEATLDEVAAAAHAAHAAEYAAPLSARADAYAAHAAARAAYAANAAGYAANAAGYYADAAGYYAARSAMLQLIRQRWPQCPMRVDEVAQ